MSTPARLLAVVTSVLAFVLVSAASASADVPVTWERGEDLSWLGYVALLVGIPAALSAVIWVFALLTARNNFEPAEPGTEAEQHSSH